MKTKSNSNGLTLKICRVTQFVHNHTLPHKCYHLHLPPVMMKVDYQNTVTSHNLLSVYQCTHFAPTVEPKFALSARRRQVNITLSNQLTVFQEERFIISAFYFQLIICYIFTKK